MVAPDSCKYHHYMLKCVKIRGEPFYTSMYAQEHQGKKRDMRRTAIIAAYSVCLLYLCLLPQSGSVRKNPQNFVEVYHFFGGDASVVVGIEA